MRARCRFSCFQINKNGYGLRNNSAVCAHCRWCRLTKRVHADAAPVLSVKQVSSRLECTTYCLANAACEAANVIRRDDTVTCQMLRDAVDTEDDLDGNSDAEYLYRG